MLPAGTFFSVDVDDTILELTIPSSPAVINLTPTTSTSAFGTATINFSAATNNQTGYTITMTPQSSDNDITSEDGIYVTYWYLGGYEATVRCIAR